MEFSAFQAIAAAIAALAASTIARATFLRASAGGAVDHYYWVLAARAYRTQQGLPVTIPGKFLLEDERQYYPPGFGCLLGMVPDGIVTSQRSLAILVAIDVLTAGSLILGGIGLGLPAAAIFSLILVYGLAPVLVAYNTQLTSRGLGNLFLTISLLAQANAAASTGLAEVGLTVVAVAALACTIATHKMTTQFVLMLWPVWAVALTELGPDGIWIGSLLPLAALALAALATGPKFQLIQWRAHWDIVTFWYRNWPWLGAHQFRQSPLYGKEDRGAPGAFHGSGASGLLRHVLLVLAYLPVALLLPVTLYYAPPPPAFVLAWISVAYAAAFATLLIPSLRCLGGGHLYIFNAVAPAALWWWHALSFESNATEIRAAFALALALTAASLWGGLRRRRNRQGPSPEDFDKLIDCLRREPTARVAAFPVTAAERIALETDHSVFWGGHGLGFRVLEPYWPIMRRPLGETMRAWNIGYAALDASWWPEGEKVFSAETGDLDPVRIGRWLLFRVKVSAPVANDKPPGLSDSHKT